MKISNAILGVGLSVAACSAGALSLGNSRGAVVLGAPVDLTFDVTPDPGSDVASSCITAKLVSGSTPIADSKVQVTPVQGAGTPRVRVRAFISADEPVLTATLTGGCSGAITRQYTFLAELPETVAANAAAGGGSRPVDLGRLAQGAPAGATADGGAGAAAGASRAAAAAAARGTAGDTAGARAPAPATNTAAATPARRAVPANRDAAAASRAAPARTRAAAASATAAPAEAPKPRLVMEPLEVWLESPLTLRSSQELPAPAATASDARRAEAAALWRALNTPPEEVQKSAGRITQLEADAATQRAQAGAERAAAADLRQRLEAAESERFPAVIVYALIALLLIAVALACWLWSRSRRAAATGWMHSVEASNRPGEGVILEGAEGAESLQSRPSDADRWDAPISVSPSPAPGWAKQPAASVSATAATAAAAAAATAASRQKPPLTAASAAKPSAAMEPAASAAAVAAAAGASAVLAAKSSGGVAHPAAARDERQPGPEALFDVQQQAEFFVSVGEHDQAIGVLQKFIAAHGSTSPSAYLELLRLFHTLSRAEAFNELSERFQAFFNARVPDFTAFHRPGRTLLEYPDTLARIEAIWPTPEVIDLIANCVFLTEGTVCEEPFDLAAFEDLLLLLSIAQTTAPSDRGAPGPRERTTPLAGDAGAYPAGAAALGGSAVAAVPAIDMLPDLSFDSSFGDLPATPPRPPAPAPGLVVDSFDLDLDLDLSEPTPQAGGNAPGFAGAPSSPTTQPAGFGSASDRFEVSFELEEQQKRPKPE